MTPIRYCSYDNPCTMRRENWYNGRVSGWTSMALISSAAYQPWREWESGQVLGDPFALLTDEELECLP